MTDAAWLARYQARKSGRPPVQPPQPPPGYAPPPPPQQPPPGYGPPPAQYPPGYPPQGYGPQPVPGAPPHAPFGYDQATGYPVAPYGRDQYGNVIVQPPQPYYPPQPQQPAQWPQQPPPPGYPQQPPYGAPAPYQPPVEIDPATGQHVVHAMDAAAAFRGGKGVAAAEACPECGGPMFQPTASAEARKLNTKTGEFAYPAGHCTQCGFNGVAAPGAATMAIAGGASGVGVQLDGRGPRPAPGGGSLVQTAGQHGMPNLFAPKTA